MVEILNAVVIINVIPARVKNGIKELFVMARFDIPSNDGIMLKIKLTGQKHSIDDEKYLRENHDSLLIGIQIWKSQY